MMTAPHTILTPRLRLRPWREEDKLPFAAMNADPRVMEFFGSVQTRAQSDARADKILAHFAERGWGLWAVELLEDGSFIGFTGLQHQPDLPFSPCLEIGWRIAHAHWGKGYAPEAARAALAFAFGDLDADEVIAVTALPNERSRIVMRKLGMRDANYVFDHPFIADGPMRAQCLFRISRDEWSGQAAAVPG